MLDLHRGTLCVHLTDAALSADLVGWKKGLEESFGNVIGNTLVMLVGRKDVCRLQECNLGT